ncbi:MAG: transketolase C-terminal domain-containing protein [Oscillospiraceae bacterium]
MLAGEGLSIRVLDMFTVKPIDRDAVLAAAADTGAIVTAENHNVIGGLGDAVARVLCAECPTPLGRIGIQDIFGEVGSTPMLMERFGLTAKDIAAKVRETIARK